MTTWVQLAADVQAWANRTDIIDRLPAMAALFEARVNRELRVRAMEASFAGAVVDNAVPLPADFLQFNRLWADGHADWPLKPHTLEMVLRDTWGTPSLYALDGASVRVNGTGALTGVYYRAIPSLYATGTNWLSLSGYDAYLFGVLSEVFGYLRDDAEQAKYFARSKAVLESLADADRRLSGPLVSRKA